MSDQKLADINKGDRLNETTPVVKKIEGRLENIPYKGPVIFLKDTDNLNDMVTYNGVMRVKIFNLADAQELAEYEKLCNSIQKNDCVQSLEEIKYNDLTKSWQVLVRWMEHWYSAKETPK